MDRPNSSELKLLKALWRAPRLSARELHEATMAHTGWSASTTRKTLDRMEAKGQVHIALVHGVKTYAAAAPKVATIAGLVRALAKDVLDMDGALPAAAFAGSKLLTAEEIAQLEAMLSETAQAPQPASAMGQTKKDTQ